MNSYAWNKMVLKVVMFPFDLGVMPICVMPVCVMPETGFCPSASVGCISDSEHRIGLLLFSFGLMHVRTLYCREHLKYLWNVYCVVTNHM